MQIQNQINPHFLYNTLDSIRGKALESGFYEVAEMTAALSMFFRYNISSKENIVPLRDELNNIDNYFKIEQFRFGNRFSLNIDNEDPSTLDCYIPKMTLQPLIENSIFHGLEPRKGGGKIKIIVTRCQNHLAISIVDDGVGMLQDRLIQLQDSLANREALKAGRDSRHSSVGIFNINERIKRLFGTQYGMSILSVENVGTEIELILPIVERPDGIGELIAGCGA